MITRPLLALPALLLALALATACSDSPDGERTTNVDPSGASGAAGAANRPADGCVGLKCSSTARGTFPTPQDSPYSLSLALPGEAPREVECPATQSFEGDTAYVVSCDATGFLLRSVSATSPLATSDAVELEVAITRDGLSLFAETVTFPTTKGPFYNSSESPDATCGPTPCWAHTASISP
jgi:hypothetical protein